ncbi:MAG: hypothetical protein ABIK86_03475 [candidate division WOR-3 bacterium]
MRILLVWLLLLGCSIAAPWENPLMFARSVDGIVFTPPAVFQDSSGVPSVIRWRGDTLVCAFQWCRLPVGGPTWDKVAVKFSYDRGHTWTEPQPIVVDGLPPTFQRPFDPTLVPVTADSLRIYFSSSNGLPPPGGDSIINTYSAISTDGIHYVFEPGARVDHPTRRVIDPAVVWFRGSWHYAAPIGAPQEGAYHYLSSDGLRFVRGPDILSDPQHNWTGNFMAEDTGELRFYGCGSVGVWFNSSPDGGHWVGYTNTSLRGGDPSVVKLGDDDYLAVFVGPPYSGVADRPNRPNRTVAIYPNPTGSLITVRCDGLGPRLRYTVSDPGGRVWARGQIPGRSGTIDMGGLCPGVYLISLSLPDGSMSCVVTRLVR